MANKAFSTNGIEIGSGKPFIIAGPCVVESKDIAFRTAEEIIRITTAKFWKQIFKKVN